MPENIGYTQWPLLLLCSVHAGTRSTLNGLSCWCVHYSTCKYQVYTSITVTLNGLSCCCVRYMQVPGLHSMASFVVVFGTYKYQVYTQWPLLLLCSVHTSTRSTLNGLSCCCVRYMQVPGLHSMASLVAVFGTCRYMVYTQWPLLLLCSAHESTRSTLQKEM